jgi:hypothetical protein
MEKPFNQDSINDLYALWSTIYFGSKIYKMHDLSDQIEIQTFRGKIRRHLDSITPDHFDCLFSFNQTTNPPHQRNDDQEFTTGVLTIQHTGDYKHSSFSINFDKVLDDYDDGNYNPFTLEFTDDSIEALKRTQQKGDLT